MPNCFQILDKVSGEPVVLQHVDERLCQHFGVPVDPDSWYLGWYDAIGFELAIGWTFAELREANADNEEYLAIIDCLDAWYNVNSWASR